MRTINPNFLRKGAPVSWGNHFGRVERQKRGAGPAPNLLSEVEQIVTNLLRELEAKPSK